MLITVYCAFLVIAIFLRFWTEGGFWQALHTGRNLTLQAASLAVGAGLAHLDFIARADTLKPYLSNPLPEAAQRALMPPLARTLPEPVWIFVIGVGLLLAYICTGFFERFFLEDVGDPKHPRKYVAAITQEPTTHYKIYIGMMLVIGVGCLLLAWYLVLGLPLRKYALAIALPVHVVVIVLFLLGPKVALWLKGTEGKPQKWDLKDVPKSD